jgi:hypothetical protein
MWLMYNYRFVSRDGTITEIRGGCIKDVLHVFNQLGVQKDLRRVCVSKDASCIDLDLHTIQHILHEMNSNGQEEADLNLAIELADQIDRNR